MEIENLTEEEKQTLEKINAKQLQFLQNNRQEALDKMNEIMKSHKVSLQIVYEQQENGRKPSVANIILVDTN